MRLELKQQERAARIARGEQVRGLFTLHPILRGLIAVVVLAAAAAGVVVMSEQFVGTIEPVATNFLGGNELFVGLIVIPVIGGVVEVTGAVGMARRKRMEITMAVTAGASIQMILLVAPVLVLVAAGLGLNFNLVLQPLALAAFIASSFVFMLLGRDGEASLLEGIQLIAFWLLVAAVAFFIKG
jgi:Ca2+:H+ antiporter